DYPQRLVVNFLWELPFGRGKAVGAQVNPVLNKVIGGWQLSGIYSAQSGGPLTAPGNADATGVSAALDSGQSIYNWFNKAAFKVRAPFTVRTLSARIGNVRLPGHNSWDLNLTKNFQVTERVKVQFRSEFFNAFNRVTFGAPDGNVTGATFGQILAQQNQPRQIQFGLKILY
ncbi:MAG: hypothetical protein NTY38_22585, partial [Acidobacteria bacterium]|nr:hypothetical protein [Acidobacteriota bacterium]